MENLVHRDIKTLLPHREPFIFVDKVLTAGRGSVTVEKHIKGDEDYLRGHFPLNPLMPGVLTVECMAQAGGLACATLDEDAAGALFVLSRIMDVKLKRPVRPGDTIVIEAAVQERFGDFVKTAAVCTVAGQVVAQGEIVLARVQ